LQYTRRNKSLVASQPNDSELLARKWIGFPLPQNTNLPFPWNTNPTPPSTSLKNDNMHLNVDVTNVLAKVVVHIPFTELIKIHPQMDKVRKVLSIEEELEKPHAVLQAMDYDRKNGGNALFFITLVVNNLLLHNCMLDYGASTNVMYLKLMD
jgi:hypothetical protein